MEGGRGGLSNQENLKKKSITFVSHQRAWEGNKSGKRGYHKSYLRGSVMCIEVHRMHISNKEINKEKK